MTDLIAAVQKHDLGSELVSLFELTFDSTTLYFHPGLDENLDEIYFEEAAVQVGGGHIIREYRPFPIEMTGIEHQADGATNRPTLTVANVSTLFSSLVGVTNEELIGATLVVRQTLNDNLESSGTYSNNTGNGALPIEFPKKKFILDRVMSETSLAITFELSAPYDLAGIKLPGRQVIGKYCSWIYQGYFKEKGGGCTWKEDSTVECTDGNDPMRSHKAYFDVDDNPLVTEGAQLTATIAAGHSGAKGYATWATSTAYNTESGTQYVEHSNTVWKLLVTHTSSSSSTPAPGSKYWIRAEICGKKMSSCKCRFQFVPFSASTTNSYPKTDKNTQKALPFGSFPGSKKFR